MGTGPRRFIRSTEEIARINEGRIISDGSNPHSASYTEFVIKNWGNVQIDPTRVIEGQILWIAPKSEVIIGANPKRLIARYSEMRVLRPEECIALGYDHSTSICTECIHGSWLWDHLFRYLPQVGHGQYNAYSTYGCRCRPCVDANQEYHYGHMHRQRNHDNKH